MFQRTCRFLKSFCFLLWFCFQYHSAVAYIYRPWKGGPTIGKTHPSAASDRVTRLARLEGAAIFASGIGIHVGESLGWRDRMTGDRLGDGGVYMYVNVYVYIIFSYIHIFIYTNDMSCLYIYLFIQRSIYIYIWFLFINIYIYMIYRQVDRYLS